MIVEISEGRYFDFLPLIFIFVGLAGVGLGIAALIIGKKVNNAFRTLVMVFAIVSAALFIGAFVNGLIGFRPYSNSYCDYDYRYYPEYGGYYYDYSNFACHYYAYRRPVSYVCLGLGCGAALFGVASFVLQLLTKNIQGHEKKKEVTKQVIAKADDSDILFYEEYSQGAIEVHDDYLVVYRNWLPFTAFKAGRVSMIIFINDIQHIEYKGCGFLLGILSFTFRHFNRPVSILFGKWFIWRRIRFNKRMTPIYDFICSKVINNNK